MINKILGALTLSLAMVSTAGAYSVSLTGPTSVDPGEMFQVNIEGVFPGGFIAGGVQLIYDPSEVQFVSFDFGPDLAAAPDPDLSCPGAALCPVDPPGTFSIVWGQFLSDLLAPGADGAVMGVLTMRAVDLGTRGTSSSIDLGLNDFTAFTGGWFGSGFVDLGGPPDLNGLSIPVNTAVVPLPAAAWLMIGGLGALFGFRRR